MRISGKSGGVGSTQGVSGSKGSATASVASVAPGPASDAVQVSSAARLMAVAQEVLAVTPDIRAEKVEALKNQLDADSYNPDGEAVAEGLLREHMAKGHHP
jgi:negative regulator of flagellin synthesis FlgM